MLYSIKNRDDVENLNMFFSLQNQKKVLRLQDKLGKQHSHEDMEKVFEPETEIEKDVSQDITRILKKTSIEDNKALSNLNYKDLEKVNDRGIIANYLLSPLSKITNSDHNSQFNLVKDPNSKRVNDLLINKTLPVTLYNNLLALKIQIKSSVCEESFWKW